MTAFIGGSLLLAIPSSPASDRLMLAVAAVPRGRAATLAGETYLVPEASHHRIAPVARSGRAVGAEPQLTSSGVSSYAIVGV